MWNLLFFFSKFWHLDWEFLYGVPSTSGASLLVLIKGNLPRSLEDARTLVTEISAQDFTYSKLLRDIQALRVAPYETWDTHDWLCEKCITEIIREHLHLWLLEQKKKSKICWNSGYHLDVSPLQVVNRYLKIAGMWISHITVRTQNNPYIQVWL